MMHVPLQLMKQVGCNLPDTGPAVGTALDADLILVGGGLANGLIAWRMQQCRPDIRLLLLESGNRLGGNHTWSFHDADLSPLQRAWLAPLVSHRWSGYSVAFPGLNRELEGGYASIASSRFAAVLQAALGRQVRVSTPVGKVDERSVTLANGRVLHASAVIDGRGPWPSRHLRMASQTFLGQELRLAQPHGLTRPVLMDATVRQQGGYRFVYLLPFSADTLLVEDTCYADGNLLDTDRLRSNIADYAASRGWQIDEVLREESGVLPITLAGNANAFWQDAAGVTRSGLAAGLFHATTGYSLPSAVRLADLVAALPDIASAPLFDAVQTHALAEWKAQGFFRLLNRMLFQAARPQERWRIMQRFYRLPSPLISRFYAGCPGWLDKARILTGKPPVPVGAAWRAGWSTAAGNTGKKQLEGSA